MNQRWTTSLFYVSAKARVTEGDRHQADVASRSLTESKCGSSITAINKLTKLTPSMTSYSLCFSRGEQQQQGHVVLSVHDLTTATHPRSTDQAGSYLRGHRPNCWVLLNAADVFNLSLWQLSVRGGGEVINHAVSALGLNGVRRPVWRCRTWDQTCVSACPLRV